MKAMVTGAAESFTGVSFNKGLERRERSRSGSVSPPSSSATSYSVCSRATTSRAQQVSVPWSVAVPPSALLPVPWFRAAAYPLVTLLRGCVLRLRRELPPARRRWPRLPRSSPSRGEGRPGHRAAGVPFLTVCWTLASSASGRPPPRTLVVGAVTEAAAATLAVPG